ncbi:hypothetical protein BaRGS_00031789 [Batillaria attramentaria]|uniref:VWFA domain-containing protein n=1 Tax=Batillaria attramentaria TaxID=370345 RepID=A0ABD0JPF1_9CAEN
MEQAYWTVLRLLYVCAGEEMHFLTLEWPDQDRYVTTTTTWEANISFKGPTTVEDFMTSTATDIGMDNFEMVKMFMNRCLKDFGARLLEVTSHRVKLGHSDFQSAQDVKARQKDVENILLYLMADTDFIYMDVNVTWEVSITGAPELTRNGSLGSAGHFDSSGYSLVADGLDSLTPSSAGQDIGGFNWGKIDSHHLLVRMLREVRVVKTSMEGIEKKINAQDQGVEQMLQWMKRNFVLDGKGRLSIADNPELDGGSTSDTESIALALPSPGSSSRGTQQTHAAPETAHGDRARYGQNQGSADSAGRGDGQSSNKHTHTPQRHETGAQGGSGIETSQRSSSAQTKDIPHEKGHQNRGLHSTQRQDLSSAGQRGRDGNGRPSAAEANSAGLSARDNNINGDEQVKIKEASQNKGREAPDRSTESRPKQHSPTHGFSNMPHSRSEQRNSDGTRQEENRNRTGGSIRQEPTHTASTSHSKPSHHDKTTRQAPSSTRHQQASSRDHEQRDDKTKQSFPQSSDPSGTQSRRQRSGSSSSTISEMDMTIEIGSGDEARLVRQSVDRAYREDEVRPPKAKSFDTMLCLDISESMTKGGAFEEMKRTALAFIDGVEDVINDSGVEENMGLVTFGGRANVIQNLTNDFSHIRDGIENMKPGGKSPFVEALLVAMAAFVRKGGIVSVSGEWDVKPRIIFISDGLPTESSEDDRDSPNNITNVRMSLSRMLISFKSSENFNKVHPVFFIPAGANADRKYMKAMSDLCDGRYLEPENVQQLCHYFRVQETIGKVLVCLKRESTNTTHERVKATVDALTPELSDDEKQQVLDVVEKELENPNRARNRRAKPTDIDYVFEDTDKVNAGERLPLGTRVIRGPDWEYGDQDFGGPGTVINHNERHSLHWVQWDGGDYNCYAFSKRRGYHIWKTDDHPRLKAENEPLEIGMTVKKGPKWNPAEAEEGQGVGMGVVIRKSESKGKIVVRWSNGVRQTCNWSPHGSQEVEYCDPREHEEKTQPMPGKSAPPSTRPSKSEQGDTGFISTCERGLWQWRDADGNWHAYEEKINQQIETQYKKRPTASCIVNRDGKMRRVMFRRNMEKVIDDGAECEVRRIPAK